MLRLSSALGCALLSLSAGCEGTVSDDAEGGGGSGGVTGAAGSPTAATGMSTSASSPTSSSTSTGSPASTTTGMTTGSGDPFAAARAACIDKINELRATKGLPAYDRWTSAEACSDQQATSDEASGEPHGAFGMCGEGGQNECLGAGPQGIAGCLESMWAEKDQPGCAGCDACNTGYDPNCPNCDFYGSQTGDVCGHYVNMSALYFSEAACGFSAGGGWDVINFH